MSWAEHFKRHVMLIIGINCCAREKLNEYPAQGRPDEAIVQPVLPIRSPVCRDGYVNDQRSALAGHRALSTGHRYPNRRVKSAKGSSTG